MQRILISRRSLVELAKNLVKIAVVGIIAYFVLEGTMQDALLLMESDPSGVLGFMGRAGLSVGIKTGLAYLAFAAMDYLYQRFEFERNLRMTKEEVKEETKSMEGDPLIKSRLKGIARRIAYRRMMHDVPKASVVITNPVHLAVALQYDPVGMPAPRVVAKGADLIAERIKAIAREHHVPIVEDQPLARALFRSVEIGDSIPEKLFQAVAQILAYLYRLNQAGNSMNLN
jgi:flagellar biosynthetic protein FlhB